MISLSDLQNDGNDNLNSLLAPVENEQPVHGVPNFEPQEREELPLDSASSMPAAVKEIIEANRNKEETKRKQSFSMSSGKMTDRVVADFSDLPQEEPSGVDIKISPQHDLLGADAKGNFLPEGDFAKYLRRKKAEAGQFIVEQEEAARRKAEEDEVGQGTTDGNNVNKPEDEDDFVDDTIIIKPNASKSTDVIDIFANEEGF